MKIETETIPIGSGHLAAIRAIATMCSLLRGDPSIRSSSRAIPAKTATPAATPASTMPVAITRPAIMSPVGESACEEHRILHLMVPRNKKLRAHGSPERGDAGARRGGRRRRPRPELHAHLRHPRGRDRAARPPGGAPRGPPDRDGPGLPGLHHPAGRDRRGDRARAAGCDRRNLRRPPPGARHRRVPRVLRRGRPRGPGRAQGGRDRGADRPRGRLRLGRVRDHGPDRRGRARGRARRRTSRSSAATASSRRRCPGCSIRARPPSTASSSPGTSASSPATASTNGFPSRRSSRASSPTRSCWACSC